LKLRGLMAIPAPLSVFDAQRVCFRLLANEFVRLQSLYPQMDTLSMGMSNDYEAAIAEGSTLLRIGTGIFGPRE
jgi:PLP dependent protein